MQSLLQLIYPDQCVLCDTPVEEGGALCGRCWSGVPFIFGLVCDLCGVPLPGEDDNQPVHCDDCLSLARPWSQGRAALIYKDQARRLVLALKHGDRLDLVAPAALWMERAAQPLKLPGQIVIPVPGHWWRTLRRRYNQAAVLAQALGRLLDQPVQVEALRRTRATETQDGKDIDARFRNLDAAIQPHPRFGVQLDGADVLLVDDVMTSGATLAASAEAAFAAGANSVKTLTLARVVKDA